MMGKRFPELSSNIARIISLKGKNDCTMRDDPANETQTGNFPCSAPLPVPPHADSVHNQVEHYWLNPPYAYVHIMRNQGGGLIYQVTEPALSPRELLVLEETHQYLMDVTIPDAPVRKGEMTLDEKVAISAMTRFDPSLDTDRSDILYYYLQRNFLGYGKIDPVMRDAYLEDLSCNGPESSMYVYHRKYGSMPTNIHFRGEELNRFVLKLAQKADKQISLTTPLIDAALPDGSRAQLTFSDVVSTKGSSFTIRKFRADPMTPLDLIDYGTYDPELLAFLWLAVENRKSMIIAGGTASGKTSTMNAISFFIPHNAKIVSLEDTREIQLPHNNWLATQTRELTGSSLKGDIDLFSLLKSSLRQRPEYIIVGEVRGREAQTLFQAMNTGHTTFSTIHAGSAVEVINRLTNEPINVPPAMFGALDLILVQSLHYRGGNIIRRCDAVHEVSVEGGRDITWRTIFEWDPSADRILRTLHPSQTLQDIMGMHGWDEDEVMSRLQIRKEALEAMCTDRPRHSGEIIEEIFRVRHDGQNTH
jgi:flagellar protein FlaI